jgi:dihydrodipicolinate synthase/N-acetylneuraminate lyase
LAMDGEPDVVWQENAATLCDACADIALGLYECPQPYHRTLTPELLRWTAQSGRFLFLKDTCCRRDLIEAKLTAIQGTSLRWFNAHCPSLLHSLRAGGHGYSGIAANFYPELFVRLCAVYATRPDEAERMQRFLTLADLTIRSRYPASAKRYLGLLGLPVGPTCRVTVPAPPQDDDEDLMLANLREVVAEQGASRCLWAPCAIHMHAGRMVHAAILPEARSYPIILVEPDNNNPPRIIPRIEGRESG